ncbi:MAG: hypothetical protein IT583_01160, partial [Verrucomicrobia bacterium]|nr:hypothetical protein [Verrucomicrobiota bacterium]
MKKSLMGIVLICAFCGVTGWSEPIVIAPKSSVFYEVKQQSTDASELNIQVRINKPKVGGVKAKALYIKLDGTTLKPDRLVERDATDKMKDGRTQIY